MADVAPGTVLAERFTVTGVLGRGGMATVYLVEDRVRQRSVALKVLHDHLAADTTMRRRLRREVEAAGLVRHEAALVAHELYEVDETLALSMPFHAGRTLTSRVADQGPLSADEVRAIGQRLAGALAEAHRHGVLHHDVTANNVLLDTGHDAVLTDFGLARIHDDTRPTSTTTLGTPGYAAPEIYDGRRTDPRSDLYSLGATLYFAATGKPPFGNGNPAEVLRHQLDEVFRPVGEVCPTLPADLADTIDALLARDPGRRPPSANEVAEALAGHSPVYVPTQPDTWDLTDLKPQPDKAEAPPSVLPVVPPAPTLQLPHGKFGVALQRSIFASAQGDKLADAVARTAKVPTAHLERPAALGSRHFRLVKGVDEATARRLGDTAETLGYRAEVYEDRPSTPVEKAARFFFLPILIVSVAFAVMGDVLPMAELLIPLLIALTILSSTAFHLFFRRKDERPPEGTTLAYGSDLSAHVDPSQRSGSPDVQPVPRPDPEAAPQPRGVVEYARESLDSLSSAVAAADLPDVARQDLVKTIAHLGAQASALSDQVRTLAEALSAEAPPADATWIEQRLTHLQTLDASGQAADPVERQRLQQALEDHHIHDDARGALHSRHAAAIAQLLEIAATAERSRRQLLGTTKDRSATGPLVVDRLQREVDAVARARQELAARQSIRRRN